MEGWIKLHRQIKSSLVYQNSTALHIWLECLVRASHEDDAVLLYRQKVTLKAGQFCMGYREFADMIKCSVSTVKYWLDIFVAERMIERQANAKGTIITVKNWSQYQLPERLVERQANAKRTPSESNKNVKNVKNVKKREGGSQSEPTPKQQAEEFFGSLEMQDQCIDFVVNTKDCTREVAVREVRAFVSYWTERTPSGQKQKWQTQKTFEIQRRLHTWFSRIDQYGGGKKPFTKETVMTS